MPGIKFALGENPKRHAASAARPARAAIRSTRMGVEYVIRDAFTRAKAYQKAWQDYDEDARPPARTSLPPRRDLQLEPLVEVLEGKRLVHAHCYRADEILMLIRLADEMGFKIATFQHVLEGYKVAKEIAAHGAGASTFSDWWGYKIEAGDAIPYNAAIMTQKGVLVSINSDSAEHARRLNTEAAKSMKWGGLTEDEALALVTINPGEAAAHRQPRRLARSRQGRRRRRLEPSSAQHLRDRRARLHRRHRLLRPASAKKRRLTALKKEKSDLAAAESGGTRPSTTTPQDSSRTSSEDRRRWPARGRRVGATRGDDRHAAPAGPQAQPAKPAAAAAAATVIAITNATIHPVTRPDIEKGTIIIRGGKIEALGAGIPVPAGAQVVDAAGADVYPGFINARTQMGLNEPGPRGFEDVNEMLDLNPQLRTRVAYHSESDAIAVARANGITTVAVMPGGGIFGGEVAVMNLDGWTWEEATLKPNVGIDVQLPDHRRRRWPRWWRRTRRRRAWRRDLRRHEAHAGPPARRAGAALRSGARLPQGRRRQDRGLDPRGARPRRRAQAAARHDREPRAGHPRRGCVRRSRKVNLVISGGTDASLVAPLLKEKNIPVILGNILSLPTSEDAFHAANYQLAGELAEGGRQSFILDAGQRLRPHAPVSRRHVGGLGHEARRGDQGADDQRGGDAGRGRPRRQSRAGKGREPLHLERRSARDQDAMTNVVIEGQDVGLDNKHERLYRKYLARP